MILSLNLRDNKQQQISMDYGGIESGQSITPGFGFATFDLTNDASRRGSQPGQTEDSHEKAEQDDKRNYSNECNRLQSNGLPTKIDAKYGPSSFLPIANRHTSSSNPTTPPVRAQDSAYYNAPSKSSLQSTSSVALGNPMGKIGQSNTAQQSEHFDYMADSICFPSNVCTTTTTTTSVKIPSSQVPDSPDFSTDLIRLSYSPKRNNRPLNGTPVPPPKDTVTKGADRKKVNHYAT